MEKIGYTKNGIKEICRFNPNIGGYCKRHVRHSGAPDKLKASSFETFLEKTEEVSYKITSEGLYTSNCKTCSGSGMVKSSLCSACSGNGWDKKAPRFETLNEYQMYAGQFLLKEKLRSNSFEIKPTNKPMQSKPTKFLPYMLGDLVKVKGGISEIKNLHTQYGVSVLVVLITEKDEKVTFFTKHNRINRLAVGQEITVKGYIKDFKTYEGSPQTILRQAIIV
jgi:hypothetical protein